MKAKLKRLEISSKAMLPTEFGSFTLYAFLNEIDHKEHIAIVAGNVQDAKDVVVRVHSECLTGDALGSLRCDCRKQLEKSLRNIASLGQGVVIYLRQEGRGIGLVNKIRAYALQDRGLDTCEANLALGQPIDTRDYTVAALMLHALSIKSIQLLTNNPLKICALEKAGIEVTQRLEHIVESNPHNDFYLKVKQKKLGHML